MMKRVTGIGGIFFTSPDPDRLKAWYNHHLGIPLSEWGASFPWKSADNPEAAGSTQWSVMRANTPYFAPSAQTFMVNYRVEDLLSLIETLRTEGVTIAGEPEVSEFGKFGWVLDADGNKVELWEPPAGE